MEKLMDVMKTCSQPKSLKEQMFHSKVPKEVLGNERTHIRIQSPVVAAVPIPEAAMVELNSKAIEVNSADEVRQAIKAVLTKKSIPECQNAENVSTEDDTKLSKEIQVSERQEYKPESGDQVHVPQQTRKRRGKPPKAGPSKRSRRTRADVIDDFYVGKLCNLVPFKTKFTAAAFCCERNPFIPKPNYGNLWQRLCGRK